MSILFTGFEPYNDALNASQVVVQSIIDDPPAEFRNLGVDLHCRIMPVDTHRIKDVLSETLLELRPACCLFMGQAPGSNRIALERVAVNLRDIVATPDASGNTVEGGLIEPDGPVGYWSTLPNQPEMIAMLNAADIPAVMSNHAGNHLCNQILYTALHWAAINQPQMRSGFLHIPLVPQQIGGQFERFPFVPVEMSRRAVTLILTQLAAWMGVGQ
jgi:pyroglutamyl-peptidase